MNPTYIRCWINVRCLLGLIKKILIFGFTFSSLYYVPISKADKMAESGFQGTRLMVVAIDLGTAYSGYAFSFKDQPNYIETNPSWSAGSEKLISMKCPTSVLLKPNQEFHSFGFEAENKYSDLAEDKKHHGWYLFRRFKMILHNTKKLQLDTQVEDISGKTMPAIDIFSHAIRFLKDHFLQMLQRRPTGIIETDIQYVITVPAIWTERAKQFMRRAANQAKILNNRLLFALEPEAASIWCQHVADDKLSSVTEPLAKFMVVDLGGGTADITVHQKVEDGSLQELHKASGGAWGGNVVDEAYISMLTEIVGSKAMERFKQEEIFDYFDLLREFETKKRAITTDTDGKISFRIPSSLRELAESDGVKIADKVAKLHNKNIILIGDKIRIEKVAVKALFDAPLNMLINHIRQLFLEPSIQNVDAVLLVGGFGESELVKEAFEKHLDFKHFKIPPEAGLAVLKGAVRFGHFQDIVSLRIAKFTIGREALGIFRENDDPVKKKIYDGVEMCVHKFVKFIEIDEEIPKYKYHEEKTGASYKDQENAMIRLFSSTKKNVEYITESECEALGMLTFDLPRSSDISDKKFMVYYFFGDTELHVRIKMLKTNAEYEKWIDCFSNEELLF